jgi:hypothetical protein
LSDLLTAFDDVLEHASTDNVTKSGLCTLNKGLTDVGDTESSLVWRCDVVVDNGGQVEGDVVLGHANLLRYLNDLDLDIDLDKTFTERVDLDETGINSAIESTEFGDETDVTL